MYSMTNKGSRYLTYYTNINHENICKVKYMQAQDVCKANDTCKAQDICKAQTICNAQNICK